MAKNIFVLAVTSRYEMAKKRCNLASLELLPRFENNDTRLSPSDEIG